MLLKIVAGQFEHILPALEIGVDKSSATNARHFKVPIPVEKGREHNKH